MSTEMPTCAQAGRAANSAARTRVLRVMGKPLQGNVIASGGTGAVALTAVDFDAVPDVACTVYRAALAVSSVNVSTGPKAARSGASTATCVAKAPDSASTGAQATSTVGPAVSACSTRTVAVAGVTVPVMPRKVAAGGSSGAPWAFSTVGAPVTTGTPVTTAVRRVADVMTR